MLVQTNQTTMRVKLERVQSKNQLTQFIDFRHDLFEEDPNYVPELFIAQRDMLTKGKHPSHQHIEFELFLAYLDNKIVGRIAAIYNKNHNEFVGANEGFFGFFDCIDNYAVAETLLNAATDYLSNKNAQRMVGPVDFSTNDPAGLLVEGFDRPPVVMMTYAKPYYRQFLERYGFYKQMDLLAYWFDVDTVPERVVALARNIEDRLNRSGIRIRTINLKQFKKEVQSLKEVYNSAWDKNWGFVPMTDDEFEYIAKDMKLIMDKDLVFVAEKEGKIIGFTLTVPDINQALQKVKRGRLLPTGLFKLLYHKRKIKHLRIITLGVLEEYRTLGIEVCFYVKIFQTAIRKGYVGAEASWILENNKMMNRGLQNINSKVYKKYRLFEKPLSL